VQTIEKPFCVLRVPDFCDLLSQQGGEFGAKLQQFGCCFRRRFSVSELTCRGCNHHWRQRVASQPGFLCESECAAVVLLRKREVKIRKPVKAGMIRVQLLGALGQLPAALRITAIYEELAEKGDRIAVHRVKRHRTLGGILKRIGLSGVRGRGPG